MRAQDFAGMRRSLARAAPNDSLHMSSITNMSTHARQCCTEPRPVICSWDRSTMVQNFFRAWAVCSAGMRARQVAPRLLCRTSSRFCYDRKCDGVDDVVGDGVDAIVQGQSRSVIRHFIYAWFSVLLRIANRCIFDHHHTTRDCGDSSGGSWRCTTTRAQPSPMIVTNQVAW